MLVHTDENPHTCNLCDKSFTQASNMKKHMLIHTGEKPHTCKLCDKSFTQASHMKAPLPDGGLSCSCVVIIHTTVAGATTPLRDLGQGTDFVVSHLCTLY